jgi:hypothetical protein
LNLQLDFVSCFKLNQMKTTTVLSLICFLLISCSPTTSDPNIKEGMSLERLSRIDSMLNKAVEEQEIPGAVALIVRNGEKPGK